MSRTFLVKLGDSYLDFVVTKLTRIEELSCTLRELTHISSGAHIIHIENDDPENVFCLSFQTLPSSSNGVAHILEHTVLCGSRKFPVKDPFFSMTRRSLNTFMNAFTGSDFTCYPAASQVETDFYNLLDVYLDAVFHPELKKESFLQEGCRLEFSDSKDINSPLQYKGIVFNEMKGSLSSPDSRLWHAMLSSLTPDLPYAYNSGGDPKEIPSLSYEELIGFHEAYYHPSRCLFFFYGNLPLKKHLDFLQEKELKNVVKASPLPPIPLQKRLQTPVRKTLSYPIQESENLSDKAIISFGWLTAPLQSQEEVLALTVLDSILMETDASPLKQRILKSGLCTQAEAFMDVEMSEVPYVITCKGCSADDAKKLEEVLFSSLREIAKKPIAHHLIEAAIHQLEFSRLEIGGDHTPFGLTLFFRSALAKQHGCEPENALKIYSLFEQLLKKTEDPSYLPSIIEKYFLNNAHFACITMIPDTELPQKELQQERETLIQIQQALSTQEKNRIITRTDALEALQKSLEKQDLSCLPKVTLQDVPVLARDFPLETRAKHPLEMYHHDCFTNHILYADLSFDLAYLPDEDLPYLQLLLTVLPELGAGKRDYVSNLEYTQLHTGGVGFSSALYVQALDQNAMKPSLVVRGKALTRKADKLFALFTDMISSPHIADSTRIEELVLQIYTNLHNKLTRNAMRYAIQLALSEFSVANHFTESSLGLHYYGAIEKLAKDLSKKNIVNLIDKLVEIHSNLFTCHNPHLILSCDSKSFDTLEKKNFFDLASSLPDKKHTPWHCDYKLKEVPSQARPIASQVAYNVKAYQTISYIHPHAPALTVATHLLDNKVLHTKIREKGGAYGCGASYNAMNGNFYFHSYRDPHIASTLEVFDDALTAIAQGEFNAQDLEEAKLGTVQYLDSPVSPGSRAMLGYSWLRVGKTPQMKQEYRDHVLSLTQKQIQHAIETELLAKKEQAVIVAFGGKELIEKENHLLGTKKKALPTMPLNQ